MKLIFSGMAAGQGIGDPESEPPRPCNQLPKGNATEMRLFPAPTMIDDEETLRRVNTSLDANGVVVVNVLSPDGPRPRYVPTTIAQFAMAHYDLFVKTGKRSHKDGM